MDSQRQTVELLRDLLKYIPGDISSMFLSDCLTDADHQVFLAAPVMHFIHLEAGWALYCPLYHVVCHLCHLTASGVESQGGVSGWGSPKSGDWEATLVSFETSAPCQEARSTAMRNNNKAVQTFRPTALTLPHLIEFMSVVLG